MSERKYQLRRMTGGYVKEPGQFFVNSQGKTEILLPDAWHVDDIEVIVRPVSAKEKLLALFDGKARATIDTCPDDSVIWHQAANAVREHLK